jgi:UDP-2,3-diacylglucosamine pyrophosphatase LpxH
MSTPLRSRPVPAGAGIKRYRSIFISDLHLGFWGCKAGFLLDFLRHVECEYLYLVGDIVDGQRLNRRWHWPRAHDAILCSLLERAKAGCEIVYLPGNHDEALRQLIGQDLDGLSVAHDAIHETADGRRLLIVHGDAFDTHELDLRWLSWLGSLAYDTGLALNGALNLVRRWLGYPYWSLTGCLKRKVRTAARLIDDYERLVAAEAARRQVAGVVCGHVHSPGMREIDGVLYVNDGDWVESCTALVEHHDGRLELLNWPGRTSYGLSPAAPWAQAARGAIAEPAEVLGPEREHRPLAA